MSKARKVRRTKELDIQLTPPEPPPTIKTSPNKAQIEAFQKAKDHDIIFLIGPPGSGKTFAAVQIAWQMIKLQKIESVIITRPIVPCGGRDKLGYRPGDDKAKFLPYVMSYRDVLNDIVGPSNSMKILDTFEWLPLDYVQGRTFKNCVAIMDEAQNAEESEIQAFMTRIGANSKLILSGDPKQSHLRCGGQHLTEIANEMSKVGAAGTVQFTADMIMRHPMIARIEKVFEKRAEKRRNMQC